MIFDKLIYFLNYLLFFFVFSSSVVGNQERSLPAQNAPKVSIHVNHRSNGAITTHISSQNSGSVKIRPHPSNDFPALSKAPVPEVQWVKPNTPREPKTKVSKVAPAPILPPRNSTTDFPSLSKTDTRTKKSSSLTVPLNNTWLTEQSTSKEITKEISKETSKETSKESTKNKNNNNNVNIKDVAPKNKNGSTIIEPSTSKENLTKNKSKKKKSKASVNNNVSENDLYEPKQGLKNSQTSLNSLKEKSKGAPTESQQNGVVKKRSELKIDSLQISDANLTNGSGFPALGPRKLPPGIATHPPPGFAANDLTFTNSSGQSYSILPTSQFIPPPSFDQRNRILVEKFMSALRSNEKIFEFKQISNMFRNGDLPSKDYYEHCKEVIGDDFTQIFPELLVLLPDIQKQQELYTHHVNSNGSKKFLEVCATCNQVVLTNDLRSHLTNHTLENHFPVLGAQEISSVWRK